jgi:hypothetical protein
VGSGAWPQTAKDYYNLGLWLADGYWWSSSLGLSSTNPLLIERFREFLQRISPERKIKLRKYLSGEKYKRRKTAWHIYVNNREITRLFLSVKKGRKPLIIPKKFLIPYLAGRIDGDGSIDNRHRSGIRIVYSGYQDASRDLFLIGKENASLYFYRQANTWVIYLRKEFREKVLKKLQLYSVKLSPRRD